ncbi:MAG TPA: T9SS type A sorting domain-containing protein, partial [Saprospiraceae bacterium]
MKTATPFWLLTFVLLLAGPLSAQTYFFSVENAEYAPIQGGQNLVNGIWDNPQLTIPIGFNFEFYDKEITEVILPNYAFNISLFESTDLVSSLFALFGADLIDRGSVDGVHLSPIRSSVTGSAGSRVFTLEFDNAGFYGDLFLNGTSTDYVNFQMKLYEENGDIVYHFGPSFVSQPQIAYGGFDGPFMGIAEDYDLTNDVVLGEIIILAGDPLDPDQITEYGDFALGSTIPENTLYRFSREPVSAVEDVSNSSEPYYYPNPVSGVIHLNENFNDEVISKPDVYDINGRLMQRFEDKASTDLGNLPAGLYELRFESIDGIHA